MSLRYRSQNGTEVIVSGLTPGGDIEAGVMATRTGTITVADGASKTIQRIPVTFSEPMPVSDYEVSYSTSPGVNLIYICSAESKTQNGFNATFYNSSDQTFGGRQVTYTAYALYTVQHAAQNAADIAEIKAAMPAGAGSSNKLTTASQLNNAVNPLTTAVSDIQDVVPSDATITNKLVSQNTLDNTLEEADEGIWEVMGKNGAKNLNSYPYYRPDSYTLNGLTFTVNADHSVTVSGTSTDNTTYEFHTRVTTIRSLTLPNGRYIVNGCPPTGSPTTYRINCNRTSGGQGVVYGSDTGSGLTIELNGDDNSADSVRLGLYIYINSGVTLDNIVFKPMIRYAEDTDSTYQPYALTNQQLTEQIEQITPAAQSTSNPNLLDNPWFTINQRGAESYTAYSYTLDRWRNNSSNNVVTLTPTDRGLHVVQAATSGSGYIAQYFESYLPSGKYTVSADVVSITGRFIIQCRYSDGNYSSYPNVTTTGITSLTIDSGSRQIASILIQTYVGTDAVIRAIKLERGSVSTLANDTVPNYATELLKCQRYQYVVPFAIGQALSTGVSDGNGAVWFPFSLPTPLRTQSGKWSLLDGSLRTHGNGQGQAATDYAPITPGSDHDYHCYKNGNIVHMQAVSIQPMTAYTLDSNTGGTLLFDANL